MGAPRGAHFLCLEAIRSFAASLDRPMLQRHQIGHSKPLFYSDFRVVSRSLTTVIVKIGSASGGTSHTASTKAARVSGSS